MAAAGELTKAPRTQTVEADIQALNARRAQRRGEALELRAVGGDDQFIQPGQGAQILDEAQDIVTDKGLAPGQANLAHAQIDEGPRHPAQLLQGEHLGLGHELHSLGHAVHAAKIAAVGHGKAQILHAPSETVDQQA